ncbi:MFS transporter [Rhizorhabdus wittichii]|uniref:MFS transporter n=1 Tax=Rhizorhabdus wittichii TaxID=160791 RepID=UPI00031BB8DB|nr:MFS transporter [Rhizorhabdus wittichii]
MLHRRATGQRYAFIVIAVTFLALLVAAALRSAPSVLILPLEAHFGWDRATISFAAAVGIFLYGLTGPFAAALMQSIGIRRTMIGGLALMAASSLASLWMTESWHYVLSWGVISGVGSGAIAPVLGATVVNRWFATRRGLMIGLLTASTATGSLIFLPAMAWLTRNGAWTPVALAVGLAAAALIPVVWLLMPDGPAAIGARRYGESPDALPPAENRRGAMLAITTLAEGMRSPAFWLLFGTFFVCGLTTNGLVGTHLIAYCGDNGISPVQAAGLLSLMGLFDLIGTTASGWLTDRYDPRKLLFVYYALRGLSLMALPAIDFQPTGLLLFAVFYGLDWIATVPPTMALANRHFGEAKAPIIFGWVMTGHQIGAAVAAFGAGLIREQTGSYLLAFVIAGAFGVLAAFAAMGLGRKAPALAH